MFQPEINESLELAELEAAVATLAQPVDTAASEGISEQELQKDFELDYEDCVICDKNHEDRCILASGFCNVGIQEPERILICCKSQNTFRNIVFKIMLIFKSSTREYNIAQINQSRLLIEFGFLCWCDRRVILYVEIALHRCCMNPA